MSEKIKKVQPNIQVGGTEAFIQESQKNMKFKVVGFEEGKCHRRIVIKSAMKTEVDEETGKEHQVALKGFAVLHMFEEILGIPVKNEGFRESGLEIEPDYTDAIYSQLVASILAFDVDSYEPIGEVNLKKGYANFIRFVENFAHSFDPSKNAKRKNIMVLTSKILIPTPEQLANPEFDVDKAFITHFQQSYQEKIGEHQYSTLFEMSFWEAVKTWILKNSRYKIPFTLVANANFSGVSYYGALPDDSTDEGKHQNKVINACASVARVLSQHNFETTSEKSAGLVRGTEAYNKIYNDWVGEPKTNRQLVQRPSVNGVIFVLDSVCTEACDELVPDKNGERKMREYIHSVSGTKLGKMDKTAAYDQVLMNPDFVDIVFKYTTGETKALMGQQMNCARWEGDVTTRVSFKDIKKLIDQTNQPNVAERINTYQPFPFDTFVEAFKKYLIKLNENEGLAWIKADESLLNSCKAGFESVGFDIDAKNVSIEDVLKNAGATTTGASAVAGLGIAINPTATPVAPTPQPVAPQPTVAPQPVVAPTPQPEIPTPTADI